MSDQSISATSYRLLVGYPGYRIGDDGSVWSQWTRGRCHHCRSCIWKIGKTWVQLKTSVLDSGYRILTLQGKGKRKSYLVQCLVLSTFVGPRPRGMQACHGDGDKDNNSLSNLRWDTPSENQNDKIKHGSCPYGEKHSGSKLSDKQALEIFSLSEQGMSNAAIAKHFDVSETTVSHTLTGRIRKHLWRPSNSRVIMNGSRSPC